MKLLFAARAIDHMAGGVERMVIALANDMAERGHSVGLFTWDPQNAEAFYPISPSVQWHKLSLGDPNIKATPYTRLKRAIAVRSFVATFKPDVIIAFQVGAFKALRLYCAGMRIPMIAAERNAPTLYDHTSEGEKGKQKAFRAFRMAQTLVVQCETYLGMHPKYLQSKIIAIPNPVYPAHAQAAPHLPDKLGRFRLLSVGRLSYQKNYKALIQAFNLLKTKFPKWDLHIIGDGEDRKQLEKLIKDINCSSRIFLPGITSNTSDCYSSSNLFCLPSRWEGFPNALAESLAHGLPAIGFSETAGVNVLIEHEKTGLLAAGNGDPESLASALDVLMEDAGRRRTMGVAATAAMAKYEPKIIMDSWEKLLRKTASPA